MAAPSAARLRAFVRAHARLVEVPDLAGLRLYIGGDVMALCQLTGAVLGQPDPDLPYWAFPWAGGMAVARHISAHPDEVAGRLVLDIASGSGLCAIVAARAGAAAVEAADIDPFAEAAVTVNARANGVRVGFIGHDLLRDPAPDCDVILAGDVCYQEGMATRMIPWLRAAAAREIRVLLGDPGRTYLPADLELVGRYRVRTSRELEPSDVREAAVFTFPSADTSRSAPAR